MYDIAIIGSGIIGSFIARELAKYKVKVVVFEKENDIANGTTMANSAIVHSGYDPTPGSIKAKMNVLGNQLYEGICHELKVDFKRIGSLTVATDEEELKTLQELKERGNENGVEVELLDRETVLAMEPNLSELVVGALYAKTAAIVYPWELAIALMENAMDNGVMLKLNHKIEDINKTDTGYTLLTSNGPFEAKIIINCAGVYADQIHNMIAKPRFSIHPRRGQYYVLDRSVGDLVSHVIFPCPSEKGKGVLVTPTTHGNILVGPNSEYIENKEDIGTTSSGLEFVREHANKTVKNLPFNKIIRSFSGLRPTPDTHDFIIEEVAEAKGFIDVAGIESPGLASAPAIAKEAVAIVGQLITLEENNAFVKTRKPVIKFGELSVEEKQALIQKEPAYGTIICRCESITEGEILDCIHRSGGARTVKGVKKRARPGMGRCQGGFCEPLVVDILARELNIDPMDVMYDSMDSNILIEETKQ
jgi:glycerol-3-phosphate dehydrogenase